MAAALAAAIALATLVRTVREYVLQGTQKRAEAFLAIRKTLTESKRNMEILALVQDDDISLADPLNVT